jgi:hypothetical protein
MITRYARLLATAPDLAALCAGLGDAFAAVLAIEKG